MVFREKHKIRNTIFEGWLTFTAVSFEYEENIEIESKKIIHEFINSSQDFEIADKVAEGISINLLNEKGIQENIKSFNFGPYRRNEIKTEDYNLLNQEVFIKKIVGIISNCNEEKKNQKEYKDFISLLFETLESKNNEKNEFYFLNPDKRIVSDNTVFSLEYYFCGFVLDRNDNTLTVIQLDDK